MFSTTEEKKEELNSRFRIREITFKWLFGEIKFTREEFLKLFEIHDHVAEILDKAFVERPVMHVDLSKEVAKDCIESLFKISEYLDNKIRELRGRLALSERGLLAILEQIRSESFIHAKCLKDQHNSVEKFNKGEYESDYRLLFSDWIMDEKYLPEFRLRVYPHFRVLIDILPDDHLVKRRADDKWYEGRALLPERKKDAAMPRWTND